MLSGALLIGGALCLTACSHSAARLRLTQQRLHTHSQALTTAVVDTLQLQPAADRSPHAELALALAREDQRIEGLPPQPIEVPPLLSGEATLNPLTAEISRLLAREGRLRERLVTLGIDAERKANARQARWAWWITSSTVLLGGAMALCVFFPVAIPIIGRVLAWLVAKLPSLASALGIVGVKAFDAVVRGIEKSRVVQGTTSFSNQTSGDAGMLESNLGREMDRDHKRLVRSRKTALNL